MPTIILRDVEMVSKHKSSVSHVLVLSISKCGIDIKTLKTATSNFMLKKCTKYHAIGSFFGALVITLSGGSLSEIFIGSWVFIILADIITEKRF
jgi:uncharacterized protein YegL